MKNKFISALLAGCLLVGCIGPVSAAEDTVINDRDVVDGSATTPVKLTTETLAFSVTVPTSLPVHVDDRGAVSVADNAAIVNNSAGPVKVESIKVEADENWTLAEYRDLSNEKVGSKKFGFAINNVGALAADGSCAAEFAVVPARKSEGFTYNSYIAPQATDVMDTIANIVFTIGWDEARITGVDSVVDGEYDDEVVHYNEDTNTYEVKAGETITVRANLIYEEAEPIALKASVIDDNKINTNSVMKASARYVAPQYKWTAEPEGVVTISTEGCAPGVAKVTMGDSKEPVEIKCTMTKGEQVIESESMCVRQLLPKDEWGNPEGTVYTDFTVTRGNRAMIGYTGEFGENLIVPATFYSEADNKWYKVIKIGNEEDNYSGGVFYGSWLKSITIPSTVTNIGGSAFYGSTFLSSVQMSEGLVSLGKDAFINCTSLTSIKIPNGTVNIGSGAFAGCSKLENIEIADSVTNIGSQAFGGCGFTSIKLPNSLTRIEKNLFYNHSKLISITIPDSVISIGDSAFWGCSSLESVKLSSNLKTIERAAFYKCNKLISIDIPFGTIIIGDSTFSQCSSLVSITIPESVTSIGRNAFSKCTSLVSIIIPNDITVIKNSTFSGYESLVSVSIPDGLTSIENYAFTNCESLSSITWNGNTYLKNEGETYNNLLSHFKTSFNSIEGNNMV